MDDAVQLLSAREQATCLLGRGAGFLPEIGLESELACELREPRALDESATVARDLLREREREVSGGEHDEANEDVPLAFEEVADRLERDRVGVLEERVEETVARPKRQSFRGGLRGIELLAHRFDEGARESYERGGRHHVGERPVR